MRSRDESILLIRSGQAAPRGMIAASRWTLVAATIAWTLAPACDLDLAASMEEVRDKAPTVCKEQCEAEAACEWVAGGAEAASARADSADRCVLECAFRTETGVFAAKFDEDDILLERRIDGQTYREYLECLWTGGAWKCLGEGDGVWPPRFDIPIGLKTGCERLAACAGDLGIDWQVEWNGPGGFCEESGGQFLWP